MSDPLMIEYQRLVYKMFMEAPSLVTTQIQITTPSISQNQAFWNVIPTDKTFFMNFPLLCLQYPENKGKDIPALKENEKYRFTEKSVFIWHFSFSPGTKKGSIII